MLSLVLKFSLPSITISSSNHLYGLDCILQGLLHSPNHQNHQLATGCLTPHHYLGLKYDLHRNSIEFLAVILVSLLANPRCMGFGFPLTVLPTLDLCHGDNKRVSWSHPSHCFF
jgi:hypothetical protein